MPFFPALKHGCHETFERNIPVLAAHVCGAVQCVGETFFNQKGLIPIEVGKF